MTDPETTRVPTPPPGDSVPSAAPAGGGTVPPAESAVPPAESAAPPRPPEPAWRPPASDSGRNASLIFGAIILVVGLWFFATRTLDLDLPDLDWGQLWPLILIGIGAWIVLNTVRQRR